MTAQELAEQFYEEYADDLQRMKGYSKDIQSTNAGYAWNRYVRKMDAACIIKSMITGEFEYEWMDK